MRFIKFICFIGSTLLLWACNNADEVAKQDCVINPALIHPWSAFGSLPERSSPYTQVYKGCGKTLIYIATHHSNNPDGLTYKSVRTAFGEHEIDFAIAEGFPSAAGVSPAWMIEHANSMKDTPRDSEPKLTVRKSVEASIGFQGGEPTDQEIMTAMSKQGITPVDLLGFYIVRQIPQAIRQEIITDVTDPRLEEVIFNMVGSFSTDTELSINTLEDVDGVEAFSAWYEKTNGVALSSGYREYDAWPSSAFPDPRKTNDLSDKVADIRDTHIIDVINDALQMHDTVLVVYGASHHDIQEPALKEAFSATFK